MKEELSRASLVTLEGQWKYVSVLCEDVLGKKEVAGGNRNQPALEGQGEILIGETERFSETGRRKKIFARYSLPKGMTKSQEHKGAQYAVHQGHP